MNYRNRMLASLAVAAAVHAAAVLAPWDRKSRTLEIGQETPPEPLVVRLRQEPKRFVDVIQPAQAPVDTLTDLIAEADSNASDPFDVDSGANAPRVEDVAEAERLSGGELMPQPQPITSPTPPQPAPESSREAERELVAELEREAMRTLLESPRTPPPVPEPQEAVAPPKESAPDIPEGPARGTVEGGVKSRGFLNFEAQQNEFAPYLKVVRNRVERRWKAAIHMRFSGSTRRRAVLDCAISADGKLASVTIVDTGGSGTYAALCKQAIEEASPFPPFPFEVPPGYRNRNLEIRWTFSYL